MFLACAITAQAEQRIRDVILAAFQFASDAPAHAASPGALLGVKETILAAIDNALADPLPLELAKIGTSRRYFDIVQKIEDAISDNFGGPIYSEELADEIGVSVRTMHNAMQQFRGMSLHRYLRDEAAVGGASPAARRRAQSVAPVRFPTASGISANSRSSTPHSSAKRRRRRLRGHGSERPRAITTNSRT